jgi:hypothetical protein
VGSVACIAGSTGRAEQLQYLTKLADDAVDLAFKVIEPLVDPGKARSGPALELLIRP